jgi:hypothetical protein
MFAIRLKVKWGQIMSGLGVWRPVRKGTDLLELCMDRGNHHHRQASLTLKAARRAKGPRD